MKVELGRIGSIQHGVVLNRVRPKEGEQVIWYPLLTISRLLQEEKGETPDETPMVPVGASKTESLKIAKEGMILVGLTSFHKAVVLSKEHEGMLISSNFFILEFPGGIVDPHYFAWYFNEHPYMEEKKAAAMKMDGKVKVLSIRLVRNLEIEVPSLVSQMAIGNLYALQLKKDRMWKEKLILEQKKLTSFLVHSSDGRMEFLEEKTEEKIKELEQELLEIEKKKVLYEQELKLFLAM